MKKLDLEQYALCKGTKSVPDAPFVYDISHIVETDKDEKARISVIGTGIPEHPNLPKYSIFEDMAGLESRPKDRNGYSTMVAGIIGANARGHIVGAVPKTSLVFIKATDKDGQVDYKSLLGSILWSTIKTADIILLPGMLSNQVYSLSMACEKATESGALIVCPSCQKYKQQAEAYPDVLFLRVTGDKRLKKPKISKLTKNLVQIRVPSATQYYTTYSKKMYAVAPKIVYALGIIGASVAVLSHKAKQAGSTLTAQEAVDTLIS